VDAVRSPVFRTGRRGEFSEHPVGLEQVRRVLLRELPDHVDLLVQVLAPGPLLGRHREQERLDEDQRGPGVRERGEQALVAVAKFFRWDHPAVFRVGVPRGVVDPHQDRDDVGARVQDVVLPARLKIEDLVSSDTRIEPPDGVLRM
jgi:hypothetical protein